ncbi:MAG: M48 family metalloprotease [Candidatus Eremiobacteraeota bacterium]|nr:M48 family metalloprotease [Candidatus Eremiobacteraeota bacterium]
MAFDRRGILRAVAIVALLCIAACGAAAAAGDRPNALDRRVDAIPATALISQPATALVDGPRQAAAIRLAHLTLPGFLAAALFEFVALLYFWSSGTAAAWRNRLRSQVRNEWWVRFFFGATLALVARAAALLPAFYLYRVDRVMELTTALTRTWAAWWILHTLVATIVAGLIAAVILWLADRTHQWYLFAIGAILGVSVLWSYASPYLSLSGTTIVPASGETGDRIHAMLSNAGISSVPVLIQSTSNSPVGNAFVLGLGNSRRIVLTDTLIAGGTPAEVLYAIAYQIGLILHHDLLFVALIEGGIVIVFSAVAVVIADRIGFRRDDDPVSRLALVGALLAVVYVAAVPVRNAALRSYVFDDDRYAVSLTGDRAAAIRAIVRGTDQQMEEVCPEMLTSFFLATHPSPAARIAAIGGVPNACP